MKRCPRVVSSIQLRCSSGFHAAEFLQDGADADIVDARRVEVGVCGEGGAEDVVEEFFGVGGAETALFGARDGRAEGGEDHDVVGGFLEDVFEAFGGCHGWSTGGGCATRGGFGWMRGLCWSGRVLQDADSKYSIKMQAM